MITRDALDSRLQDVDSEVLADETMTLLQMGLDELYTTLGAQLMPYGRLSRTAGIVSFLMAGRSASMAQSFSTAFPTEPALAAWARGLSGILDGLREQGQGHLAKISGELQKALCHQDIFQLSDQMNRATIEIVTMIVGATLRMPRDLDPLCATIAAIILKTGVRNFCHRSPVITGQAKNDDG